MLRRAIVLFVPDPARADIDAIRTRWDPVMCRRIGSHITLVHHVTDHERADALVAEVAARAVPFPVTLRAADRWGPSAWGIYLHVDDPTGGVASLHAHLAEVEEPRWARVAFRAHVTLVHSRTTPADVAEAAWVELDGFDPGWVVDVAAIDVVEMDEATGWRTIARHPLTAAVAAD